MKTIEIPKSELMLIHSRLQNNQEIVKAVCEDLRKDYQVYVAKQKVLNDLIHDMRVEIEIIKSHLEKLNGNLSWGL